MPYNINLKLCAGVAALKREYFNVSGMSCAACSNRVERAVSKLRGVDEVMVNLLKNTMEVSYREDCISANDIISAVRGAGYGASQRFGVMGKGCQTNETLYMKRRVIVSFAFAIPLVYISLGSTLGFPLPDFLSDVMCFALAQLLLVLPIVLVNFKYYRTGFSSLFKGSPNMDTLIALGSGAAMLSGICSICAMFMALSEGDLEGAKHAGGSLYFESAAMILSLITLGRYFEEKAKSRTSEAIRRLMDLSPKFAIALINGKEVSVPVENIAVGDILSVKAGAKIPVDGIVIEGTGLLDESALTGESMPISKKNGDSVSGATVNLSGHFLMRAVRVGEDTAIARIIKLVDDATSSKAPIARLADKVSGVFVPFVICAAALSALTWIMLGYDMGFAISTAISVLVVSCPCALGLATPTAIMVGTGKGAEMGILFKSAQAVEALGKVDTVVLDKTGTITEGRPSVSDVVPLSDIDSNDILTHISSLERLSEHSLASAIVSEADNRGLAVKKVSGFRQIAGQGVSGFIDGALYIAGNALMMSSNGIRIPEGLGEKMASGGKTPLYCARDGVLMGIIAVYDKIRQDSRSAIESMNKMGLTTIILTGDNSKTAAIVKEKVKADSVLSELLPQDKDFQIRKLRDNGRLVAMVGDGINDAPALARADVGIAIGTGTDIAVESADVVLVKSGLSDVVVAINLGRAVLRNIKQNLFWAFFYNAVGIPVAAGAFYTAWGIALNPIVAAAAMSFSSVSVVANSLRLRFFKPDMLSGDMGESEAKGESIMHIKISVDGMNCPHCAAAVEKALKSVNGVVSAEVDLSAKKAYVETKEGVAESALKKAVEDAGFKFSGISGN